MAGGPRDGATVAEVAEALGVALTHHVDELLGLDPDRRAGRTGADAERPAAPAMSLHISHLMACLLPLRLRQALRRLVFAGAAAGQPNSSQVSSPGFFAGTSAIRITP